MGLLSKPSISWRVFWKQKAYTDGITWTNKICALLSMPSSMFSDIVTTLRSFSQTHWDLSSMCLCSLFWNHLGLHVEFRVWHIPCLNRHKYCPASRQTSLSGVGKDSCSQPRVSYPVFWELWGKVGTQSDQSEMVANKSGHPTHLGSLMEIEMGRDEDNKKWLDRPIWPSVHPICRDEFTSLAQKNTATRPPPHGKQSLFSMVIEIHWIFWLPGWIPVRLSACSSLWQVCSSSSGGSQVLIWIKGAF